ncbi:hypothetical protein [Silvanigrella sp.]|jgi:hypothetical protein|uniref:hypothetical protein n=1 Tax=Silvanigrella sp. TaxID=2024976 RepID=UPI0037CC9724
MIKKGIFIVASLMIVGCGVKNNENNNAYNTQDEKPLITNIIDATPKTDPLEPKPKPIPEPEPIKPDPKPEPVISEALNMLSDNEINFKISTAKKGIYSDCTKPITERGVTVHCTIDNAFKTIDGDFHINIKKELPNKLIFTYTGVSIINKEYNSDNGLAKIDCSNKTVQEVFFYEKGITPSKIQTIENGCKTNGLVMVPLINKYSWFNSNEFLNGIFTEDGSFVLSPYRRPDRSQVVYLESY